jgi:hypothetical protein
MTKPNSLHVMPVVKTIKGDFYHIIELPFESKEVAVAFAKNRNREYPAGVQKVIPSKDRKFWGVYEKVTYDHIPEQHLHPKGGKK